MKGLFIKDLKLLGNQKKLLFIAVVLFFFFMLTMDDPLFVVNYLSFFGTIIALGTLSYDELNNGMTFMFTLPVSKRQYVLEKYLFCFLTGISVWVVTVAISSGYLMYKGMLESFGDYLLQSLTGPVLVAFITSLMLPLQIKLGQEKARTGIFVIAGVAALIFVALKLFIAPTDEEMNAMLSGLSDVNFSTVMIGAVAVALILLVFSYLLSVAFIKRKEY